MEDVIKRPVSLPAVLWLPNWLLDVMLDSIDGSGANMRTGTRVKWLHTHINTLRNIQVIMGKYTL